LYPFPRNHISKTNIGTLKKNLFKARRAQNWHLFDKHPSFKRKKMQREGTNLAQRAHLSPMHTLKSELLQFPSASLSSVSSYLHHENILDIFNVYM
jgi:hypothetical protein